MKVSDEHKEMIGKILSAHIAGNFSFISEKVLNDLVEHNVCWQKIYIDENGKIKLEHIPYEDTKG